MKKTDVIKLLGMLAAAYPNMKAVDETMVDIWYECLKDIEINVGIAAIKKNILESPFPPTIADIRKQASEVVTPQKERLDGSEAWGEVVQAIRNHGYYQEKKALASMSIATAKVVKYMGWQDICHGDKVGVVRGQFLRMYDTVAEREKQDRLLPNDFKKDIEQLATGQNMIQKLADGMDMGNMMN